MESAQNIDIFVLPAPVQGAEEMLQVQTGPQALPRSLGGGRGCFQGFLSKGQCSYPLEVLMKAINTLPRKKHT